MPFQDDRTSHANVMSVGLMHVKTNVCAFLFVSGMPRPTAFISRIGSIAWRMAGLPVPRVYLDMEHIRLGLSGPIVSRIGLGCMSLPLEDPALSIRIIHAAMDAGINLVDTADLYDKGRNEEIVGQALKGCRDRVVLATKVGNRWRSDGSSWDWDPSPGHIRTSVEGSLRRFKTDRIDLYQLHGGTLGDPVDEVIGVFESLRAAGKILYYGISSIRPNVTQRWVDRSSSTSVMTQYSLADRRPEECVLPFLEERGTGVLARGVLCRGLLCGKPPTGYLDHSTDAMARASAAVHASSHSGRTPAQTAIRYVLHSGKVSSAVVGAGSLEQLGDMASTFSSPDLSDEEHRLLSDSIPPLHYAEHR